ncbi:PAAR domain-containing protein [Massilia sp. Dwa41.01b]|uniref:PAAR domain-containing protein n=1 Tax=unclassified Massilia TaxID=2609279 RepID=UPI001602ADA0|nr:MULTISPECIES: PAAR domain-containing protein [unclassified Massilia]QNA88347.1 PAAR domain-containing protein [Massilia sp. Dwa41.01b]QNA99246.1 PAAR domain-containing protein [Massilia sp. Se16.2.3]
MPNVIRLGDTTSHGGKVVKVAARHYTIGGIPVACVGDVCTCPMKGHDGCTIAEGNPTHLVEGVQVAYDGHKTSCGASLIASQTVFTAG